MTAQDRQAGDEMLAILAEIDAELENMRKYLTSKFPKIYRLMEQVKELREARIEANRGRKK